MSHTHPQSNILSYQPWHINRGNTWQTLTIAAARKQGKTLVAQLQNVSNPEQAQVFLGTELYIEKSQLPRLKKDEYYWQDLVGLTVINQQNITLGTVSNLVDTGANLVLVVSGEQEHWLPYIAPFLIKVDINQRQILVDWDADF